MRGVRKERFKRLMYHQGGNIRYERVKDSNLCVKNLIFDFFFLLPCIKFFFQLLFRFFNLTFYYLFSFFI
jgi:hypothetical protein